MQLLEALAERADRSQSSLAQLVGLTPARVNAYIRMFVERRYITTASRERGLAYHLTARGRHCLAFHQVSYRAELVRLRRAAQTSIREFFVEVRGDGVQRIALYGAGETADVVLESLTGTEIVSVLVVLDDAPEKQGTLCHGVPVVAPGSLGSYGVQAIVITSVTSAKAIRAKLTSSPSAYSLPVYSLVRVV